MKIVFFAHPDFLGHQSMPRFTAFLAKGMEERGHQVAVWSPEANLYRFPVSSSFKKWLGYIDQYLIFSAKAVKRIESCSHNTLFVFTDQALGPWVPLVAGLPTVIHCHDFLAQHSALGKIPENPISWTGRQYQAFIRRGYVKGKNFISVSQKTRQELHKLLPVNPVCSEVVYNGVNKLFAPINPDKARKVFGEIIGLNLQSGYILHVGGNAWYKNRVGVLEAYNALRLLGVADYPLLFVGELPDTKLQKAFQGSPFQKDIHFLNGLKDYSVHLAYAGASVFLFPSFAEGFGWPIAEAMASGSLVITTGEAPMTEVCGQAGFLIPRMPQGPSKILEWATTTALLVKKVLELSPEERASAVEKGLQNIRRFDAELALDQIESIYSHILKPSRKYEAVTCGS